MTASHLLSLTFQIQNATMFLVLQKRQAVNFDLRNEVTDMSKFFFVIIMIIIILLLTSGSAA